MNIVKKILANDTYLIRKEVLRKGIDKSYKFDGDFDNNTFHLGAFQQEKLVGIATLMQQNCELLKGSQYQLRGMATLPEVRGYGFGNLLLYRAFEELTNKNTDILWCNARKLALPFYKKNEFNVLGNPFEIDLIGTHYKMYRELK